MFPGRALAPVAVLGVALAGVLVVGAAGAARSDRAGPDPDSLAVRDSLAPSADSAAVDSLATARAAAHLTAQVEAGSATPESAAVERPVAVPVFLGGREIFVVRAGRGGLAPEARASAIRTRLTAAVRDGQAPADSVRLVRTPEGIEVRLRQHFLWIITAADVGGLGAPELAVLISDLPAQVREGVVRERAGRRPLRILISAVAAVAVTLLAWLLVRLLLAASRRWRSLLDRTLPRYLHGIRFRNFEVLSQAQIISVVGGVLARLDVVAGLLLLYGWLTSVFSLFPWTQGWSWLLLHFASERITDAFAAVAGAVPGILVIAGIFVLFKWLTALSDRFFDAVANGALQIGGFHPELARPSKRLMRILLWIVALMIAYPYIPGSQTKAVQGVSILLGVMVSLGSTGFVGNVIAGIVLTYSRSFSVGERVRIGDHDGDVVSLGFFATKLRSVRNEEVTLPNGQVAAQAIINYTRLAREQGLILHTEVTIGYDVDWRRVHAMMIEAAGRVEGVEREPSPWVYQRALNDHHVSYELNAVTHRSHDQLALYSRLHEEIQDGFARAGVEILSPAYQALRDANATVLPVEPKGPRPEPGGFRVRRAPEA